LAKQSLCSHTRTERLGKGFAVPVNRGDDERILASLKLLDHIGNQLLERVGAGVILANQPFRHVPRTATEVRQGEAASEPRRATPPCIGPIGRMGGAWCCQAPNVLGSAIIGTSKQRCLRSENFCDLCGLLCQKLEDWTSNGPGPYSVQPDVF
jgi:hypothetical protein